MATSTDNQIAELINAALAAVQPGTDLAIAAQNKSGGLVPLFTIDQLKTAILAQGLLKGVVAPRPQTADIGNVPTVQADLSILYAPASGGAGGGISKATVVLTDAQVKALPSTPIQLVAAPGANKMLVPFKYLVHTRVNSGAYTNINAAAIMYVAHDTGGPSGIPLYVIRNNLSTTVATLLNNAGQYAMMDGAIPDGTNQDYRAASTNMINKPLVAAFGNKGSGALTGGNAANTVAVTVWYDTLDMA